MSGVEEQLFAKLPAAWQLCLSLPAAFQPCTTLYHDAVTMLLVGPLSVSAPCSASPLGAEASCTQHE